MTRSEAPDGVPRPRPARSSSARWPGAVRRPGSPEFEQSAKDWLLDLAPARWRHEEVFHRNPLELACMLRLYLDAEVLAMQAGLKALRTALIGVPRRRDDAETIEAYVREQAWARAVREQVRLIEDALHVACGSTARKRVAWRIVGGS
ncbi:hypothetical protein [Streptomyces sp. BE20]|uniref:hypothetical protein n=1 Tax=Streptomycetaceae TaxID=2062 RepID=UPI002E75C5A6|nr:hypothetical protein [Streptomyces sp. BE20]MEE1827051.1 hypothetical protein [Streptomyces sp. BE20]